VIGRKVTLSKVSRCNVTRRVLAIYLSHSNQALSAKDITRIARDLNINAVKVAIHRLYRKGFLKRIRRGYYFLVDKEKAILHLSNKGYKRRSEPKVGGNFVTFHTDVSKSNNVDGNAVRRFYEKYLDLDSIILEHSRIRFGLKRSVAEKVRVGREGKKGDKAGQVTIRRMSFTLVVSKYGRCRLYVLDPYRFLKEFLIFLASCGLTEQEIDYVLGQINIAIQHASATAEIPVVESRLKNFRNMEIISEIKTKDGYKPLIKTKIVSSHFPLELEVNSVDFRLLMQFIGALTGQQHSVVLEYVQANELSEINKKFDVLAKGFSDLAETLRDLTKRKVELETSLVSQKVPPQEVRGEPGYVT